MKHPGARGTPVPGQWSIFSALLIAGDVVEKKEPTKIQEQGESVNEKKKKKEELVEYIVQSTTKE